jgi:hypothetical protein
MHARRLYLGIYATYGKRTCMGYAGTFTHEDMRTDARTFAAWGADYLKLDGCFNDPNTIPDGTLLCFGYRIHGTLAAYVRMGAELNRTHHEQTSQRQPAMAYACSWPFYVLTDGKREVRMSCVALTVQPDYDAIVRHCNVWRNFNDIAINWASIVSIIDFYTLHQDKFAAIHGPGHWNDPDMVGYARTHTHDWVQLVIGNPGISANHARVQMSLWCAWSAPLMMSNDLRNIDNASRHILQHSRLIAINQDPMGVFAKRILQVRVFVRLGLYYYSTDMSRSTTYTFITSRSCVRTRFSSTATVSVNRPSCWCSSIAIVKWCVRVIAKTKCRVQVSGQVTLADVALTRSQYLIEELWSGDDRGVHTARDAIHYSVRARAC